MTKIALLGYGTIGSGVAEVLRINKEHHQRKRGDQIEIKYFRPAEISGRSEQTRLYTTMM